MRRAIMTMLAGGLAMAAVNGLALAQTTFAEIAGKWEAMNTASGNRIDLLVDSAGQFSVASPRASDAGTAKIDGSSIVFGFAKNAGNITVTKKGDALEGTVTVGAQVSPITFNRKK